MNLPTVIVVTTGCEASKPTREEPLNVELLPEERALLQQLPERDLTEMAVDLDVLLDADIDRDRLIVQCIEALLDRAEREGLPLSKYDAEDLQALPPTHLQALGAHIGVRGSVTVRAMLKSGAKTWRQYRKNRPKSPTALLVPLLLGPLARAALARQEGR